VAFAYDTATAVADRTSDYSGSHAGHANVRGVLVLISQLGSKGDQVVSVTYGGVALTRKAFWQTTSTETYTTYAYFLGTGVPTGTRTWTVDINSNHKYAPVCYTVYDTVGKAYETFYSEAVFRGSTTNPTVTPSPGVVGRARFLAAVLAGGHASAPTAGAFCAVDIDLLGGGGSQSGAIEHRVSLVNADTAIGFTTALDDYAVIGVALYPDIPPIAVGQATETDTAWPIHTSYKLAQATETDTALPMTPVLPILLGIPSETDTATALAISKTVHVGQVTETDLSQRIARVRTISVLMPLDTQAEIDTAWAVSPVRIYPLGMSDELDWAGAITHGGVIKVRAWDEQMAGPGY